MFKDIINVCKSYSKKILAKLKNIRNKTLTFFNHNNNDQSLFSSLQVSNTFHFIYNIFFIHYIYVYIEIYLFILLIIFIYIYIYQ